MQYIYARVSTEFQSLDAQIQDLTQRYPQAQLVSETASGAKNRPLLKALVGQLQKGDTLIVAALDRLGRRLSDVLAMIESMEKRGIILVSVREGVDYSTITGRLVTQVLLSVAEMERGLISERTKAGLQAARSQGRVGGRRPIHADALNQAAVAVSAGAKVPTAAKQFGVSRAHLYRFLATAG